MSQPVKKRLFLACPQTVKKFIYPVKKRLFLACPQTVKKFIYPDT